MPLGLPSSVKYINRANRPKRFFRKRADGTLEEYYPDRKAVPDDPDRSSRASAVLRDHEPRRVHHARQQGEIEGP